MMVSSEVGLFGHERPLFSMCTVLPKFPLLALLIAAGCCLKAQQSQFRPSFNEFVHTDGTVGASFAVPNV